MTPITKLQLERILVPIDFSPSADLAFRHAMQLAEEFDARVDVMHVFRPVPEQHPPMPMAGNVGPLPAPVLTTNNLEEAAQESLQQFIDHNPEASHRLGEAFLVGGTPAQEIVEVASQTEPDLIAMGTRGRTGLSRLALGSVAETVLRHVSCPVLLVPSQVIDSTRPTETS